MLGWLYTLLLLAVVAFVLVYGEREERTLISLMLLVGFGTYLIVVRWGHDFDNFNLPLVLNETLLLVASLIIAYRSKRFWPLPFASLEFAVFLSLLAPLFGRNLVSYAMGVAQGLWAYPQLTILVLAVVRQRNRGKWTSSGNS